MSAKATLKRAIFGSGPRPFRIRLGLLRGANFVVDPAVQSLRLLGLAETEIAGEVRRLTREARSAVDVGASDGWYTVYFGSCPNISRVVSCEPDPDALRQIAQNVDLNGPEVVRKVRVVPGLVGSAARGANTLDSLCDGLPEPIVIKIDIEGAELECLQSGKATLADRRASLLVETHSAALERDCLAFCRDLGYQTRLIDQGWYRAAVPELRPLAHNRWFTAWR